MKNVRTAKWLMGFTLVLLSAFQVYWLHKLYGEEFKSLQRNTDVLFRETLYNLQVDRFKNDSSFGKLPGENLFMVDMFNLLKKRIEDTTTGKQKRMIISIDTRIDSLHQLPLLKNDSSGRNAIFKDNVDPGKFMKSFHDTARLHDSIPILIIDSAYKKVLSKSGININFLVLKISDKNDNACTGSFCTGNVPMGIFGGIFYQASFDNPFMFLIKKISTQILLSVLLIALTFISFFFIYRNLLAQKKLADIKNEFISNITHELKTPISTVSVAIEAMKNFNAMQSPERTAEYLDIAGNELQRLTMLVDKVLKLSMFEQQQIELKYEPVDVKEPINEVLASMRLQFEKSDAAILFDQHGNNFIINADRMHILSVLYNLLDNALKYSAGKPQINIDLTEEQSQIIIKIADKGKGIPPEFKDKIFEKFFRVPGGDIHNIKGYGLGLSYVMHIIKKHKGNITLQSEIGKGSTFIIKIPIGHEQG